MNTPITTDKFSFEKAALPARKTYTFAITSLLLSIIVFASANMLHAQLIPMGNVLFDDYFALRSGIEQPSCDRTMNIDEAVKQQIAQQNMTDDGLGDLFAPEPVNEGAIRQSIEKQIQLCEDNWTHYETHRSKLTPAVERYREMEQSIGLVSTSGVHFKRPTLILLLFLCAIVTTWRNHHIALRPITTLGDHRLSNAMQLVAYGLMAISVHQHRAILQSTISDATTNWMLILTQLGFIALAATNVVNLLRPTSGLKPGAITLRSVLTLPLITIMTLSAAYYFHFQENHFSGLSIHFKQMPDNASIFVNVGLYIWVGMMLKQTELGHLIFNCLKPWKLSPTILAAVVVLFMGFPTAYTGASGIIVIALGGVIFQEMRHANTPRPLALATTAMSGSLGIVLSPCLLVALIAALNREVTTDQLYQWGMWVFLFTSLLFAAMVHRFGGKHPKEPMEPFAMLKTTLHAKRLLPYVWISVAIVLIFRWVLDAPINTDTAPVIIPTLILAFLVYEHRPSGNKGDQPLGTALSQATSETVIHIGALLALMGLSMVVGGVIERSEIIHVLPEAFGNVWIAMALLCVVLVILGMTMDPFGAVILVTGTIAAVGYANGIHPVHFWMTALVAFELGYLTPPVALNQLLARQVVGEGEAQLAREDAAKEPTWWARNLQYALPVTVMAIALILVAFVPLFFYEYTHSVYQIGG